MPNKNINLTITSENDATTRNNVPDWLVHLAVNWEDANSDPQSTSQDRYLLLQLNWLRTNYPARAKDIMEKLVYRIERVRQGIDDVEQLRI